jgi:Ca-activated chloride channel family protein
MLEYVYHHHDPRQDDVERRYSDLERLYHRLLLAADGDVQRAIAWLERLDARYSFFDENLGLADFLARLERKSLIERERGGGGFKLTASGERALARDALDRIFGSLQRGAVGDHRVPGAGAARERLSETRKWEFGDDLADLDVRGTVKNALRRGDLDFELEEPDFEVFEGEALASCSTVIAIDVSHSMTLYGEDRITPAKQVALALVELIRTRYRKDELSVVLFGDDAREVPLARIPYVSNGPFHTNTRAGLRLASRLLMRSRHPNRQIFMITDGKPSALTEDDGTIYKNPFGLDERVVNKTLEEAQNLRRRGIVVTTFMLTDDPYLVDFVERFTRAARGRAFYSSVEDLGSALLVDYIKNRRRPV